MATGQDLQAYKELLLFLGTAAVIVPLVGRLKISPALGFLTAGVALGPFALGALAQKIPWFSFVTIGDAQEIELFAEFGVAFLFFSIGLEISLERLLRMRKLVFGLGSLQVLISSLVLGGLAYLIGETPASAAVIGSALAMSSTALVLPSLAERKRLNSATGRVSFAVLLFQDLAVAPLLFMVTLLGAKQGTSIASAIVYSLGPAILALGGLVVVGRLVLRPLFELAAAAKRPEVFVAACLLVVATTGLVTAAAGQSMTLGAFVAGLLLAETEYRRQVEVTIQPFQGLLLGLFFLSVGARLDLTEALHRPLLVLAIVAGIAAIKGLILVPLGRLFGLPMRTAVRTAAILGPGGEFALVLIGAALTAKVVSPETGGTIMVAATLSMFTIPVMVRFSERLLPRSTEASAPAGLGPVMDEGPPRVIVVGYGRVGDLVGQMLATHQVPFLAVDGNPAVVMRGRQSGASVFYGDATQAELLRLCGIANARALVVTMDSAAAVELVVIAARAERPDLPIIARARDAPHAAKLYSLKVTDAVPETIEASLQLSEALLVDIGIPMGSVIASIHEKRDEFRQVLQGPESEQRQRRAIRLSARV